MKKIFVFLFLIYSCNSYSQSNWFVQPVGSNSFLWDVFMVDVNTAHIAASGGLVLRTTDGGSNWIQTTLPLTGDLFSIAFPTSDVGYTAGSLGKIFKTTNGGINWTGISSPTNISIQSSFFVDDNTGFIVGGAPSDGEIFKTTNGGINWTEYGPGNIYPQALSISFPSMNTGYVCGNNGLILKSTNSGINWTALQSGLGSVTFFSIFFSNQLTGYAVTPFPCAIIKTTNGGTNWSTVYSDTNHFLVSVDFPSADTGFAVGGAGQQTVVVRTTNAGLSWQSELFNFNGHLNSVDFINSSTGYIAGDLGRLYKTTNGGAPVGIENNSENIPDEFFLYQNFPNPFNPVTVIRYSIIGSRFVALKIYDVLGNSVASLLNKKQSTGNYELKFDGSNLPGGIYFYRLEVYDSDFKSISAGKFSQTKKMLLVK
jgi:photosystem II stability/assembly factor-like uncharacterized protein